MIKLTFCKKISPYKFDTSKLKYAYDGSVSAQLVMDSFIKYTPLELENSTFIAGENLQTIDIKNEIMNIKSEIEKRNNPKDQFIIYMTGHGLYTDSDGNENSSNVGDEFLDLNGDRNDQTPLTDDMLTTWLDGIDISKWVFADFCYSGGFWDSESTIDIGDLIKLSEISFMAPITEDRKTIATDFERGGITSVFSESLIRSLRKLHSDGTPITFESLTNLTGAGLDSLHGSLDGKYVVEMGLGDLLLYDGEGGAPVFGRSDDFTGSFSPEPVPEPATFLLLGTGLCGLVFYRRRTKK